MRPKSVHIHEKLIFLECEILFLSLETVLEEINIIIRLFGHIHQNENKWTQKQ